MEHLFICQLAWQVLISVPGQKVKKWMNEWMIGQMASGGVGGGGGGAAAAC